jgi:hypothetical protein
VLHAVDKRPAELSAMPSHELRCRIGAGRLSGGAAFGTTPTLGSPGVPNCSTATASVRPCTARRLHSLVSPLDSVRDVTLSAVPRAAPTC